MEFSQADFAALADASKRAQIDWEKGTSSPNAVALSAFADAGADVLYILTGKRAQPVATASSEAEARLSEIEPSIDDPATDFKPELTGIAEDENLPDRTRARADQMLRFLGDAAAEARHRYREARRDAATKRATLQLEDACGRLGWNPPPSTRATIVHVIVDGHIDNGLLELLLVEMRSLAANQE